MAEEGSTTASSLKGKETAKKCQTCGITFHDIFNFAEHLESKEHIKNIMKNKYGPKYLEAKEKLLNQKAKTTNEQESDDNEDEVDDDECEVYTCEVCEKICTGYLTYKLHLSGKKHKKKLKEANLLKKMKKDKILPEDNLADNEDDSLMNTPEEFASSDILCKVCNKKCPGPIAFQQHNQSGNHKKKLATQKLLKDMGDKDMGDQKPKIQSSEEDDDELSIFKRCDICDKGFSGPIPYKQHLESISHQRQIKNAENLEKFKDLINNEEDSKFKCEDCNKYFNGPLPFHTHLKSSSHLKLKKRNKLIKDLQEKYSELVIRANSGEMDNEDSDEDNVLTCTICHTVFSGPESAVAHVESQKHKKTLKEKKRFDKFKLLKKNEKSSTKSDSNGKNLHSKSNEEEDEDSDSLDSFQIIS